MIVSSLLFEPIGRKLIELSRSQQRMSIPQFNVVPAAIKKATVDRCLLMCISALCDISDDPFEDDFTSVNVRSLQTNEKELDREALGYCLL